jgi:centromere-binding protein ParB
VEEFIAARERPAKGRVTADVDADVLDRARNAVWQLTGPPERLTMAELVEQAVRREVERLEAKHNDGVPFPPRSAQLRAGRPLGR